MSNATKSRRAKNKFGFGILVLFGSIGIWDFSRVFFVNLDRLNPAKLRAGIEYDSRIFGVYMDFKVFIFRIIIGAFRNFQAISEFNNRILHCLDRYIADG